jgi:hypothetical protein
MTNQTIQSITEQAKCIAQSIQGAELHPISFPDIEQRFHFKPDLRKRYNASNVTLHRWGVAGLLPKGVFIGGRRAWTPEQVAEADLLLTKRQDYAA